jgi:uncharacterized membrane protein AbrB (regulator of aidB expression)
MLTTRQLVTGVVLADVALFLLASAINDHSNTSVDGIIWFTAIALFAVLVAIATAILGRFLWTRWRRPARLGRRSGRPR